MTVWKPLERVLDVAGRLPGYIVGLITLGIGVDVVTRNLGIGTIGWMIEVVEYLLYAATFLGAPYLLLRGGHVTVDILISNLRPGAATLLAVLTGILIAATSAILTWATVLATLQAFEEGSTLYKTIIIKEWVLLALMPVSFAALTLVSLRLLYLALRAARHPETGGGEPRT